MYSYMKNFITFLSTGSLVHLFGNVHLLHYMYLGMPAYMYMYIYTHKGLCCTDDGVLVWGAHLY